MSNTQITVSHKTLLEKEIASYTMPCALASSNQDFFFSNQAFQSLFSSHAINSVSDLIKKISRKKVKHQIRNYFEGIKNRPFLTSTFSILHSSISWQILILPYPKKDPDIYLFYFLPHIESSKDQHFISDTSESLKKESEYFEESQALFHRSMEGIFLQLINGQFLDFNEKAREILEIPESLAPGQFTLSDFLKGDEYEKALYLIPDIIEKKYHEKPVVYEITTYKGNTRYLQTWTSIVYKDGMPYAFMSTSKDITELLHYKQEIGQLRLTFKTFLNNIKHGFLLLDLKGNVLIINRKAVEICEVCNLPIPHVGKKWIKSKKHPFLHAFDKALQGETITTTIHSNLSHENTLWFQVSFWPVYDNQQKFYGIAISLTDITTSHKLQETLIQKELFYETLIKNIDEVIILLKKDYTIYYASPSMGNIFGNESQNILQASFLNYLSSSSQTLFKDALKTLESNKKNQDIIVDLKMNCPPKGVIIAEAMIKLFPNYNTEDLYLITLRDVTKQRQNEREAERYLRIFKSVFESSLDGLALFSPHNLKIWDYSNRFLSIMGFLPFQTAIGYSLIDLFHNVEGISLDELKDKFLSPQGWEGEFSFINKLGKRTWVDASILHLDMPQGTWGFLRLRDITIQKEQTKLLNFIDTAIEKAVESIIFLKKSNNKWTIFKKNEASDRFFKNYLGMRGENALEFFQTYWSKTGEESFIDVLNNKTHMFQKKIEISLYNAKSQNQAKQNYVFLAEFIPVFLEENNEKVWIILIHDITYEERIAMILKQKEEEKQRQIMEAIFHGQEEERKRVAEDLHDSIGPLLSVLKMQLSMIYEKHKDKKLNEILALVDQITQEIRSISKNLMPTTLHQLGFVSAVKELINHIQKHTSLRIHLDISEIYTNFEPDFTLNLFRVIQEAFNNIIKHAEATEVYFQLNEDEEGLWIIIEDDGKGFDVKSVLQYSKGMGLKNIQARIHLLGGSVEFDSQPGRGTTITIDIPYLQKRNAENEN